MSAARKRPKWRTVLAVVVVGVVLVALGGLGASVGVGAEMEVAVERRMFAPGDAPTLDTAIVLGARPGPLLTQRMDAACLLVASGKVTRLVLTGLPEEMPTMRERARACVAEDALLIDDGATRTLENLRRAQRLFGLTKVLVVTQRFHMPRALYLADALGLEATGVLATGHPRSLAGRAREHVARLRAVVDVALLD